MKKALSILSLLLVLGALIAGLVLVKNNQETRRGAFFGEIEMWFLPDTKTVSKGEQIDTIVKLSTTDKKVTGVDIKIKYDQTKLKAKTVSPVFGPESNKLFRSADNVLVNNINESTGTITLAGISPDTDQNKFPKGVIDLFKISFEAIGSGAAKVGLDTGYGNAVSGFNAAGSDQELKISQVKEATYTVGSGTITAGASPTAPAVPPTAKPTTSVVIPTVPVMPPGVSPTAAAVPPGIKPTTIPTVQPNGKDMVLNYKVAFDGVKAADSKCGVGWPVVITVLGGGKTVVYTNVPTKVGEVNTLAVYGGSLVLKGFDVSSGVAVFIKGSKHLQMKYGINNQTAAYSKAGGEIVLTSDSATSPSYDFSKYPVQPGDVAGVAGEGQDGVVNSLDFAYEKGKSTTHEMVAEGGSMIGDLDGNCQLNTNDLVLLKKSLEEKQGQLY